jgi:hypothetical protein
MEQSGKTSLTKYGELFSDERKKALSGGSNVSTLYKSTRGLLNVGDNL